MPGWPTTFANLTGVEPLSLFDTMFNQVAAGMEIPCSAAGTNLIALTPLTNFPALSSYNELGGYRFRAAGTSTGAVTLQYNGLAVLNLYKADGATQANVGDLQIGQEYVARFSQSLNGGAGGFFLEAPAVSAVVPGTQTPPGGRLSLVNNQPTMFASQSAIQNIFYPPYLHPFVPIYNGSVVQMYQFTPSLSSTTGLTLALGGASNFTNNNNFDVFAYLNAGSPALCAIQWTNLTTRATTLSVFGGFLTNSGSATAQTGPNTSVTLPANQGTFLGTFWTNGGTGACSFVFGGAASGGSAANFGLCNYYNKVEHTTIVSDNGASYTYTSATIRQARASAGNQISFLQCDSERSCYFAYLAQVQTVAQGNSFIVGVGLDTTTAVLTAGNWGQAGATAVVFSPSGITRLSATGAHVISANEGSDGTNATIMNRGGSTAGGAQLQGALWL